MAFGDGRKPWDAATLDRGWADRPDVVVPILRSGILARQFCERVACAHVDAVFERCIYLRSGDDFVCIGEPGIGNGPDNVDWTSLGSAASPVPGWRGSLDLLASISRSGTPFGSR
jgi:hypothetical protein